MITDEYIQQMLAKSKEYFIVVLMAGPNENSAYRQSLVWEHVRRNFELRQNKVLSIVCPVAENPVIKGIGIFSVDKDEVKKLMDDDPTVKSGVFTYEILSARSFPGDSLP
jgi:hypothetical protein